MTDALRASLSPSSCDSCHPPHSAIGFFYWKTHWQFPNILKAADLDSTFFNHWRCALFQEGLNIVENRTSDIIQETRKLQIRKKGGSSEKQKPMSNVGSTCQVQQPLMRAEVLQQMETDLEIQLKASRDVRWQLCITGLNSEVSWMYGLTFFF